MLIHKHTIVLCHVQVTIPITSHIKKTFNISRAERSGREQLRESVLAIPYGSLLLVC